MFSLVLLVSAVFLGCTLAVSNKNFELTNNDNKLYGNADNDYYYSNDLNYFNNDEYSDYLDDDEYWNDEDGTTSGSSGSGSSGSGSSGSRGSGGADGYKVSSHQVRPDTSTPELHDGMIVTLASVLDYNNNVVTHTLLRTELLPWHKTDSKKQKWRLIQAGLTNWKFQNLHTGKCIGLTAIPKITIPNPPATGGTPTVPAPPANPPAAGTGTVTAPTDDDGEFPVASKDWRVNTQNCWTDKKDHSKSKYVEWELNSIHHRGKHMGNLYVVSNPHIKRSHGCMSFHNIATYGKIYFSKCKYGAPAQFIRMRCHSNCQFKKYTE